jgi:hypothetical protein
VPTALQRTLWRIQKRNAAGNLLSKRAGNATQQTGLAGKANRKLLCENKGLMNAIYDVLETKSNIDCF